MKDLLDSLGKENNVKNTEFKLEKNKTLSEIVSAFEYVMQDYFGDHKDPNSDDFLRYAPEVYGYQINEFCTSLYHRYNDIDYISFSLGEYISALINKSKDSVVELNLPEDVILCNLAIGLENKRLIINGNLYSFLGKQMRGGEIIVFGNTGTHLGMGMIGGSITINGNATNAVGANMFDGIITINGDVGEHAGQNMNGGLIVINGNCGRLVGFGAQSGMIKIYGSYKSIDKVFSHATIYHNDKLILKDGKYLKN